jgi:prepilin-type processing-associated H-X9-DG protein
MADSYGRDWQSLQLKWQNFGHFVALTAYYEQGAVFNALNSSVMLYEYPNSTISGFGISILWCPSDEVVVGLRYPGMPGDGWDCSPIPMTFSSYAGNLGPLVYCYNDPNLDRMNGMFAHNGNRAYLVETHSAAAPASFPPVRIAGITDGTSNTIMYGEHAHAQISQSGQDQIYDVNWWSSGDYGDTTFSTMFPPNFFPNELVANNNYPQMQCRQDNWSMNARSMHPGGANFSFVDGSVRFIRKTIDSWNASAIQFTNSNPAVYNLNGERYGVYQALSTRNGGEVLTADQY